MADTPQNTDVKTEQAKKVKILSLEYAKQQYRKAKDLKSFVLETLKENKAGFLIAAGCTGAAGLLSSAAPLIGKYAINLISSDQGAMLAAVAVGTAYACTNAMGVGLDSLGYTISSWFYRRMRNRMSTQMLAKVFNLPPLVHAKKDATYLPGLVDTVAKTSELLLRNVFETAYFVPVALGSLAIVATESIGIAAGILATTTIKIGINSWMAKKLEPDQDKLREKENDTKATRQDLVMNYRFLESHGQTQNAVKENNAAITDILKDEKRLDKKWIAADWVMRGLDVLTLAIMCCYIVPDLVLTHDAGTFAAIAAAAATALGKGTTVGSYWRQIKSNFLQYQNTVKALQYDRAFELQRGHEKISDIRGVIKFQDVSATYPLESKPVFQNINLELYPGTVTVLAGKSGVGKTTFIRLLQHMMEPSSGKIFIDGHDVSQIEREELFKNIAIVHQEQQFLERKSILENLRLVRPDLTNEEIFHVMRELGLHEDVLKKKDGYDSKPKELSGGQKQRLGIAQALLQDSKVVICDEPTANLDPESKAVVYKKIKELAAEKGKVVIVISHNLVEMALSDRIIYMDKGKIVEDGSPAELIHQRGRFWEFFKREKEAIERPFTELDKKKKPRYQTPTIENRNDLDWHTVEFLAARRKGAHKAPKD